MKTAERRWSWHVWFWGFAFLFLTHAVAVFWFAERRDVSPSWQKPAAFFHLSSDREMDRRMAETITLRDPTLFALPHAQGVSGRAWLNFQPQLPRLSNWFAPPEWLSLPIEQLGTSLEEYAATNRPSEEPLLASLRAAKTPEVRIPDEPIITRSSVHVEETSANRRLLSVPPLPSMTNSDVLSKTIVAVSVNGDGVVESAALARESGSKLADDRGVGLARALRFEPLAIRNTRLRETAPPTIVRVVFTWHVPPTNALAAAVGGP